MYRAITGAYRKDHVQVLEYGTSITPLDLLHLKAVAPGYIRRAENSVREHAVQVTCKTVDQPARRCYRMKGTIP
jgi:hypothetical protein